MSKFRARALDATKPMPIFRNDELPDLPDFAAINRAVPQMPSGMEKEEECEHHLQRAISAQQAYGQTGDLVIPTPEVYECANSYEYIYPEDFKIPRQFIHMQPSAMEQDIPDYDMDSEDERWVLEQQSRRVDVTALQFEEMMDRLEKGSGQHAVSWKEAKALLDDDDDLVTAVYDYWLNKRLRTQHALIPQVRTERRDGSTNNNPYVAFRRRTEKMQTRKNRKNDEVSYEKMLKLRRDLSRAVTLIEMVKRREKAKREHLHLNIEIFEKRYQASDFSGQLLADVATAAANRGIVGKQSQAATAAAAAAAAASSYMTSVVHNRNQHSISRQADQWSHRMAKAEVTTSRKKREYKKRKHKEGTGSSRASSSAAASALSSVKYAEASYGLSSEDELLTGAPTTTEQEFENDPDGRFAFRRKKNCTYHAPILEGPGNWPWCSAAEGGLADRTYRYCLTSLSATTTASATTSSSFPSASPPQGRRCIGFARRRIGRGGRFLLDRAHMPLDDWLLDHPTGLDPRTPLFVPNGLLQPLSPVDGELLNEIKTEWLHFRPRTPPSPLEQQERRMSTSESPPIEVVSATGVCSRTNMFFSDGCSDTYCRPSPSLRGGGAGGTGETNVVEVYDDDDDAGGECGNGARSSEFSVESFQSHQEELLEMQRRQLERLTERTDSRDSPTGLSGCGGRGSGRENWSTGHSCPLASSTSHFTVDSASAQFAVSAVVTTTVRQSTSSSPIAAPTTTATALSVVSSGCRSSGLASTNGPINLNNISCNTGIGFGSSSNKAPSIASLPLLLGKASMRTPPPIKTTSDLKLAQFSPSVTLSTENALNSCDPVVATTTTTTTTTQKTDDDTTTSSVKTDSIVIENLIPMEVT